VRVPVQKLDDDPVGIAYLERALAPLLGPERHRDRDALCLQSRQLALEVVHGKGENQPGCVVVALIVGMDDEQWWAASAPVLERVLGPDAYPLAVRVGTAAGTAHRSAYNPQHACEFGLRTILDGLAALIEGRP
jgi:hypothetical protein